MLEVPWWALSPSPFSITFYLILATYGTTKILKLKKYRRLKHLVAFTDAILILGFIVLALDILWLVACGLRFGWYYPSSVLQLIFSVGRNIAGITLCYLLIGNYFRKCLIRLEKAYWVFSLNLLFLLVWFVLAPSPAWTDWTYAIRHNYSMNTVLSSFFISHIIGKSIVALIYIKIW